MTSDGTPARWQDPGILDHLEQVRKPWDRLTRRIVRATLSRFLPTPPGQLVEIGAGGGQLRDWLPRDIAAATIHTDPSEPFLTSLRVRYPDAVAVAADATDLPFPDASVGAVLGLCVLDTVPKLASVRHELRRILRPGGVVVHFLDLATSPECVFPELLAGGEIPLTNFARDPALLAGLPDNKRVLLPPAEEFDEILAIGWEPFTRFVRMLESARHPIVSELGPYAGLHRPGGFDPDRLAHGYMTTSADPARLFALNKALLTLTLTARELNREWLLRPVSSLAQIREQLLATFSAGHGFGVKFASPVLASETSGPRGGPPAPRLTLRHAGRTIRRADISELPGMPVREWDGGEAPDPQAGEVRATTVEVFVAIAVAGG